MSKVTTKENYGEQLLAKPICRVNLKNIINYVSKKVKKKKGYQICIILIQILVDVRVFKKVNIEEGCLIFKY